MNKKLIKGMSVALITSIVLTGCSGKTTITVDNDDNKTEQTSKKDVSTDLNDLKKQEGRTIYVYGISNDEAQQKELDAIFKVDSTKTKSKNKDSKDKDENNKFLMDAANVKSLVKTQLTGNFPVYSSAKVTPAPEGYGIQVNILTPKNITSVTLDQYRNAIIDLGVPDIQVDVASAVEATGDGALASIIFAIKELGVTVPKERAEIAQEGLTTMTKLNELGTNNKDTLSKLINDVKVELVNKGDSDLSESEIKDIILKVAKQDNVKLSDKELELLVKYFVKFNSNKDVLKDKNIKVNSKELKEKGSEAYNSIKNNYEEFANSAAGEEVKGFLARGWESVKEFFSGIFSSDDEEEGTK